MDESIGIWSEIKKVNLPFTVKKDASNARGIVATLSSFNNIFNAIKNDTTKADHTVGIISLMKNEEVYCIYISYKTNILVSNVVKVHEFPTGSDIDRCYVSSEGFVYGSDSKNNKTYRCYPNNDEKGFGIRSINAIDTYDHDVISRCVRGNEVLSVYDNSVLFLKGFQNLI